MKMEVNEHGSIELSEVFSGVTFKLHDLAIGVCMRDDTIELTVGGETHIYDRMSGRFISLKAYNYIRRRVSEGASIGAATAEHEYRVENNVDDDLPF